jgi:hypothetical protein
MVLLLAVSIAHFVDERIRSLFDKAEVPTTNKATESTDSTDAKPKNKFLWTSKK